MVPYVTTLIPPRRVYSKFKSSGPCFFGGVWARCLFRFSLSITATRYASHTHTVNISFYAYSKRTITSITWAKKDVGNPSARRAVVHELTKRVRVGAMCWMLAKALFCN